MVWSIGCFGYSRFIRSKASNEEGGECMAMNRNLRTILLQRLSVTPQRLSQRVKEMKTDHGPMSTEDATYVIAHQEGLDLTKYLDAGTVSRIRSLIPKGFESKTHTSLRKSSNNTKRWTVVRIEPTIPQVDALLSTTLAEDAKNMALVYPKYYVLENSIRVVIKRTLEKKYGVNWWKLRVANPVQVTVTERMQKEAKQPWHGKRGQHEIFYSDFGDLKKIITKNWNDFEAIFPSQAWISQKLDELEHPRNVMAHHNPLRSEDLKRIDLYFSDWIALLKLKKNLIPQ
jgi:hypothetical protein